MIDKSLLDAIKSYSEKMTRPITFILGSGEHSKRAELIDFFELDWISSDDYWRVYGQETPAEGRLIWKRFIGRIKR